MYQVLALVGRPNVGKSTIFNRLIKEKKAVISDVPGTTRDRIYGITHIKSKDYIVVDTGGITKVDKTDKEDSIEIGIQDQTQIAIEEADIILLVLDGISGLFNEDRKIIRELQKSKKEFIVIVNKVDSHNIEQNCLEKFGKLGIPYHCTSSIHGLGFNDLFIELSKQSKKLPSQNIDTDKLFNVNEITVSIIGKPNVGKSSIMNAITGKNTSIVSNVSGTTRDAVDTKISYSDKEITIVDTAGLRRRSKIDSKIEYYSYLRSLRALEKSDIAVLVSDATESISHYEKTIFQQIEDSHKGCILVINKWDLIEKDTHTMGEYTKYLRHVLPFCKWVPIIFTSALDNKRLTNILDSVLKINDERLKKINTSTLNSLLEDIKLAHPPAALNSKKKHPKLNYITQTNIKPPTFTIFVNDKKILHSSYLRFIEKRFREIFSFEGTPIKFNIRNKNSSK